MKKIKPDQLRECDTLCRVNDPHGRIDHGVIIKKCEEEYLSLAGYWRPRETVKSLFEQGYINVERDNRCIGILTM